MKKQFTDETIGKDKNDVAMRIEPKMLPVRFRERSAFNQRIYILLFVVLYSAAIGVITFTLMHGLAEKMQGVYKENRNILIITMMISMFSLFSGSVTTLWARNRKLLFTGVEFALLILPPIIMISGFLFLQNNFNYSYDDPRKLLFIVGLISLLSNAVPIIANLIKATVNIKRYKSSFMKALFISPGNLIFSAANLVLWLVIKYENGSLQLTNNVLLYTAGTAIAGIAIGLVGLMVSMRWDIKTTKSLWTSVRVIGALPVLLVYTMLFVIGIRFMEFKFSGPILFVMIIDGILIGALLAYVLLRGGIKNLVVTNPIYNNVVLRIFVILVAITGLVIVSMLDRLVEVKDFGPPSFTILTITSLSVLIGVIIAHIGKVITYTKFLKAMIISAMVTLLLVIVIVMSIIILKRSEIILAIISRQLISIFLIFSIVTEMIALAIDVVVTVYKIVTESRKREHLELEKNKEKQRNLEGTK